MSAQGGAWYPAVFQSQDGEGERARVTSWGGGGDGLLGRLGIFKGMFSVECW